MKIVNLLFFFGFCLKKKEKNFGKWPITFWACNDGATLIGPFFDLAVLADGLGERADLEEAHEHRIVTGAVEARLVGDDTVTFAVVLEHVVTSCTYTKGEFFLEKKKIFF
jgi:hypothetical protein